MPSLRRTFLLSVPVFLAVAITFFSLQFLRASVASDPQGFIRTRLNLTLIQCPTVTQKITFWNDLLRAKMLNDVTFDASGNGTVTVTDAILLSTAMVGVTGNCNIVAGKLVVDNDDPDFLPDPQSIRITSEGFRGSYLRFAENTNARFVFRNVPAGDYEVFTAWPQGVSGGFAMDLELTNSETCNAVWHPYIHNKIVSNKVTGRSFLNANGTSGPGGDLWVDEWGKRTPFKRVGRILLGQAATLSGAISVPGGRFNFDAIMLQLSPGAPDEYVLDDSAARHNVYPGVFTSFNEPEAYQQGYKMGPTSQANANVEWTFNNVLPGEYDIMESLPWSDLDDHYPDYPPYPNRENTDWIQVKVTSEESGTQDLCFKHIGMQEKCTREQGAGNFGAYPPVWQRFGTVKIDHISDLQVLQSKIPGVTKPNSQMLIDGLKLRQRIPLAPPPPPSEASSCDDPSVTPDSAGWLTVTQGDIQPRRQLYASYSSGTLNDPVLELTFHADVEDVDVTYIRLSGATAAGIENLELWISRSTEPLAIARRNCVEGALPVNDDYCAIIPSGQFVIPAEGERRLLVKPRMKIVTKNPGEKMRLIMYPTPQYEGDLGMVRARGMTSDFTYLLKPTPVRGSVVLGNLGNLILGDQHPVIYSKILSITGQTDPAGSIVPSGIAEIGRFYVDPKQENGNNAALSNLVFTIHADNVLMSNQFSVIKGPGSHPCQAMGTDGTLLTGNITGTFYIACDAAHNLLWDTRGFSFRVFGRVYQRQVDKGRESSLQVSLESIGSPTPTMGLNASHILWLDATSSWLMNDSTGTAIPFNWVENAATATGALYTYP